jgi:2,3-bisphosphoglycerate-dependent phosphoglycerate mutase
VWRRHVGLRRRCAAVMYADDRYADLPAEIWPRTESLADVWARMLPYWSDVLFPQVLAGETPLVVGHGSSLRAFVAYLEKLGPAEVERLDIPTAVPMRYRLDRKGDPIAEPGGRYLDPVGAREQVRVGGRTGIAHRCVDALGAEVNDRPGSSSSGSLGPWPTG